MFLLTEAVVCELLSQALSHRHAWDPLLPLHGLEANGREEENITHEQQQLVVKWKLHFQAFAVERRKLEI